MPPKRKHDLKEIYPSVCVSTLVSSRVTVILTKNSCFCHDEAIWSTKNRQNDIKFGRGKNNQFLMNGYTL